MQPVISSEPQGRMRVTYTAQLNNIITQEIQS